MVELVGGDSKKTEEKVEAELDYDKFNAAFNDLVKKAKETLLR